MLLAVPAMLTLAGAAACGTTQESALPAPTSTAASSAGTDPLILSSSGSTGGGSAGSGSTGAGSGSTGTGSACGTADIKPTLTEQPQRREGDTRMAILSLVNASKRTCELSGWPVVTLVNAADQAVRVPTSNVAEPGKTVPAKLVPGGSAAVGIKWVLCDKGDADCPAGNTIKVGLASGDRPAVAVLAGFPDPEDSNITMKSLQVGTVQPSQQGIVSW
jgi:hypothetical protein